MMRYWLASILGLCLLTVACQGEDGEPANGGAVTPLPTSLALPTAAGTPIITDSQFDFPDKGYSVRIPDGWSPRPNLVGTAALTVDGFFSPSEEAGIQPNISVVCEAILEGTTLEAYFESKRDLVKRVTGAEPEVIRTEVSGQQAFAMEYTPTKREPLADRRDVVFVNERCGWTISLVVPQGQRSTYEATLNEFIASFRLLP
ncbi:MAG: hypothetical protein WBF37_05245 [Dehalococcoidia bacterium]